MNRKTGIQKLVICAVMIALHIVLEFVSIRIGNDYKVTFSGLPILMTSFLFGPLTGCLTGLLGTFLSQLLTFGITVTTPLWILPGAVLGLASGLLFKAFSRRLAIVPVGVTVFVSKLIYTLVNLMATYFDSKIFNYYRPGYLLVVLPIRLLSWVAVSLICTAVIMVILKAVSKKFPALFHLKIKKSDV